jgi:hypothetical protein
MPHLCLLGISLLTQFAQAADRPTLAVVGLHQAELTGEAHEDAVEAIVKAASSTGVVDSVGLAGFAAAVSGRESVIIQEGLVSEASTNLAAGRTFYNQAEPDNGIPLLESAVEGFILTMAGANSTRDLWDAYLYLGCSHYQLDQIDEAKVAFAKASALSPDRAPDAALFPPDLVELYTSTASELAATPMRLEISVDSKAELFVDGASKGIGPMVVEGLLPGEHFVLARGSGQQAYARLVIEVAEGGMAPPLALTMGPASLGDASTSSSGRGRQAAELYKAIGNHSQGVDYVLLAGVDADVLHLQLYGTSANSFSRSTEIPYSGSADDEAVAAVPLLLNVLNSEGALPATATAPKASPIHVGTNDVLAAALSMPDPKRLPPLTSTTGRRRGAGTALAAGGIAVGVAALVGGGVFLATRGGGGDPEPTGNPNQGKIVVGPF